MTRREIVLGDTITTLPPEAAGAVVVTGSHGGLYPGYLAATARVHAIVFNDAGIGLHDAGVAGLTLLDDFGVAAAAVSHLSCRIGFAEDALTRGRISRVNSRAAALGVMGGMSCQAAVAALALGPLPVFSHIPAVGEGRSVIPASATTRALVIVDSASLVEPATDIGAIVVTGSHGGLIGGDPAKALKSDAFAAVFNDAGGGVGNAGVTRLPALEQRGIRAFTVAAASARIGDARSSYEDGSVSAVNALAAADGATLDASAREIIDRWLRR